MPKIDRLTIQGFRAFGPVPAKLDFDAPIAVVWGQNSEGKTSLAEAVEFLFTGDIARRELLSSAVDEFENALRNAHLPAGAETYVEALITGSDGKTHTIRRTLVEDFTKRKACTSELKLDGTTISTAELGTIGIELSEPPLAASVAVAQDNPASQTLITNVHVFDGVNKARVENANVLIEDNLIRAAGFWQEIFSACRLFF